MGPGGFFPTNPDLADILGDTDFDFDNFYVFGFFGIPNFQISRFQISKFPEIWPGPALGRAGPLGWGPRLGLGGSLGWARGIFSY